MFCCKWCFKTKLVGICIKASKSGCSHKSVVLSVKLTAVYVQLLFTAATVHALQPSFCFAYFGSVQYQIATVGGREYHREPNAP